MVFPVLMYGYESWTIKTAEHQRIGTFEMWCWRRFLRVPWKSKEIKPVNTKGDQSWIFTGRTDAEVPIFLATWCNKLTHWKRPWFWERLRAGGEGRDRRWDGLMVTSTQWIWVWINPRKWWRTGKSGGYSPPENSDAYKGRRQPVRSKYPSEFSHLHTFSCLHFP